MRNACYHPYQALGCHPSKGSLILKQSLVTVLFFLLCLGSSLQALHAQSAPVNMGTSWLRIPDNARDGAMAEAMGAVPDTVDEAVLNPAGLGLLGGTYLTASHSFWIQNLSLDHFAFTLAEGGAGFSFGGDYINFGSISTYNVVGPNLVPTGSYTPIAVNGFAAFGTNLGIGLHAGLTGHFIYDNIQQSQPDQTASMDAGLLYQMPQSPLALSVVLSNLGFSIDNSLLPLVLKTAVSGQIWFDARPKQNYLTLASESDLILTNNQFTNVGFGGEYWYNGLLAIRGGYRFINTQDLTGVTGLTAGAGLRFGDLQLDYSFMTLGDLGNTNQIELSVQLGSEATPTPTPKPSPMPTATPAPPMPILTPAPVPPQTMSAQASNKTFMDYYRAGIQAYMAKNYQEALDNWFKAIVLKDPTVQPFYYAEACAMIGVVYKFDLPNHFLAHQFCNAALKIDPTTETALKLKHEIDATTTPIEAKYWDAEEDFEKGRYELAVKKLRQVIDAHDPTTPSFYYTETYCLLGVIYQYHLGEPDLAYQSYQEALKIDPKARTANENIEKVTPPTVKPGL